MDRQNSIAKLQFFVTGLSNGAFAHLAQGKHFEALGLEKLGAKYVEHFNEEMGWVSKFISRIYDLGGEVKIEDQPGRALITDPIEYIKADLEIQTKGVDFLYATMETLAGDPTTYELMKGYLADEEEDLYWSQGQLELIELIGRQNWLAKQV